MINTNKVENSNNKMSILKFKKQKETNIQIPKSKEMRFKSIFSTFEPSLKEKKK